MFLGGGDGGGKQDYRACFLSTNSEIKLLGVSIIILVLSEVKFVNSSGEGL